MIMEAIPAPLDFLYDSYEEAYDALKTHGRQHGYGFVPCLATSNARRVLS
jgi:hypothetical protein